VLQARTCEFIILILLPATSMAGLKIHWFLYVGSDYTDNNSGQKSESRKKGYHIQVACKSHGFTPDHLCLTKRY